MRSLSAAVIEKRIEICFGVDQQACQKCGESLPPQAARDPEWKIDARTTAEGTVLAEIHCPDCRSGL